MTISTRFPSIPLLLLLPLIDLLDTVLWRLDVRNKRVAVVRLFDKWDLAKRAKTQTSTSTRATAPRHAPPTFRIARPFRKMEKKDTVTATMTQWQDLRISGDLGQSSLSQPYRQMELRGALAGGTSLRRRKHHHPHPSTT